MDEIISRLKTGHSKHDEAILQSNGFAQFQAIGAAAGSPSRAGSARLWKTASNIGEGLASVVSGLQDSDTIDGLSSSQLRTSADPLARTTVGYLGVQQLLAGYIPANIARVRNIIRSIGKPLDDRQEQLEDVVAFLSTAAVKAGHAPVGFINDAQGQFINLLWKDLPHPRAATVDLKHRYRTADDSENCVENPTLGAAGTPYARTVRALHPLPPNIASPEEIFDACLRRPEGEFEPHPAHISSLLFAFANIIIHDIFWTDPLNPTINKTSSYLSLSPLYGIDEKEQATVRDKGQLGRGLLHPDTFASSRILLMPPASSALFGVILTESFAFKDNRIAKKVLELNERGTWQRDPNNCKDDTAREAQDNEIFGTARHCNCAYFTNIILSDYLQAILGTVQADTDWKLDPRMDVKSILGNTPTGGGNAVSIEFNVLYRWHAPISKKDTQWLEERAAAGRPDRNWDAMTLAELRKASTANATILGAKHIKPQDAGDDWKAPSDTTLPYNWKLSKYETTINRDGTTTYVGGVYERTEDKSFKDADIAKILKDATNEVAGAYGARKSPAVFKLIDSLGIKTARDVWRTCTLNEFRDYLGLKRFDTFLEWNEDPEIARAAADIWGHPNNIELYPGLMAEQAKKPRLGAGLCGNFTLTRAIMSDAVSLVRGDRFYNSGATVLELTQWGMQDCQPDPQAGSYGGILGQLIQKNLPDQYVWNDVALLFPFQVPKKMIKTLSGISKDKARDYVVNQPVQRPLGMYHKIDTQGGVCVHEHIHHSIVENTRMRSLFGEQPLRSKISNVFLALSKVVPADEWTEFDKYLVERISVASHQRGPAGVLDRATVDIVRDVVTPVYVGWLAHIFGIVQTGFHSRQHILCALSDLHYYMNEAPQPTFKARTAARVAVAEIRTQLKNRIEAHLPGSFIFGTIKQGAFNLIGGAVEYVTGQQVHSGSSPTCDAFYHKLCHENAKLAHPLSGDELTADVLQALSLLGFCLPNAAAVAIDYLVDKNDGTDLLSLAQRELGSSRVKEELASIALESVRVNHWDPKVKGMVVQNEHTGEAGVPIGVIDAHFKLQRAPSEYCRLLDLGQHCLPLFKDTIPYVLHRVFSLPNVARASGTQGNLNQIMITSSVATVPSLVVVYDGPRRSRHVHNATSNREA